MTPNIKRLSRAKDYAHRAMTTNPTPANIAAFRRLRENVKKEVQRAKVDYVQRTIGKADNPHQFWQAIKKLTGKANMPKMPDLEEDGCTTGVFLKENFRTHRNPLRLYPYQRPRTHLTRMIIVPSPSCLSLAKLPKRIYLNASIRLSTRSLTITNLVSADSDQPPTRCCISSMQ